MQAMSFMNAHWPEKYKENEKDFVTIVEGAGAKLWT